MAGMAKQLRTKAKSATSSTRSNVIVKSVSRKDLNALKRTMEPIIRQNARERIASEQAAAGSVYGVKF